MGNPLQIQIIFYFWTATSFLNTNSFPGFHQHISQNQCHGSFHNRAAEQSHAGIMPDFALDESLFPGNHIHRPLLKSYGWGRFKGYLLGKRHTVAHTAQNTAAIITDSSYAAIIPPVKAVIIL